MSRHGSVLLRSCLALGGALLIAAGGACSDGAGQKKTSESCTGDQIYCASADKCIDPQTDNDSCGGCINPARGEVEGVACGLLKQCTAGQCKQPAVGSEWSEPLRLDDEADGLGDAEHVSLVASPTEALGVLVRGGRLQARIVGADGKPGSLEVISGQERVQIASAAAIGDDFVVVYVSQEQTPGSSSAVKLRSVRYTKASGWGQPSEVGAVHEPGARVFSSKKVDPKVVDDGTGVAVVLWNRFDRKELSPSSSVEVWKKHASRLVNGTWSTPQRLETQHDLDSAVSQRLLHDASGKLIAAVFTVKPDDEGDTGRHHWLTMYDAAAGRFSPGVAVDSAKSRTGKDTFHGGGIYFGFPGAIDGAGNIVVAWAQSESVWLRRYDAGQSRWQAEPVKVGAMSEFMGAVPTLELVARPGAKTEVLWDHEDGLKSCVLGPNATSCSDERVVFAYAYSGDHFENSHLATHGAETSLYWRTYDGDVWLRRYDESADAWHRPELIQDRNVSSGMTYPPDPSALVYSPKGKLFALWQDRSGGIWIRWR